MDRWIFSTVHEPASVIIFSSQALRLFDGDRKTDYKEGNLVITSHNIEYNYGQTKIEIVSPTEYGF